MTRRMLAASIVALLLTAGATAAASGQRATPAAGSSDSVYVLDGQFTDQSGRPVRLDVERGHPVLMSMFYASCRDACPVLLSLLRRIDARLPSALRADVRLLLVSLDPDRDSPAMLSHLAADQRLDARRWRLLSGADDTVREVAAVLGVKFRRRPSGMIDHSSVIVVLDRRGVIESRTEITTAEDSTLTARVGAALERAARPADR
jgi:protein SCO1